MYIVTVYSFICVCVVRCQVEETKVLSNSVSYTFYQSAEMDLDSQTRQIEHHNTKGKQLTQETRAVPQFDSGIITEDVDKLSKTWKNSAKVRCQYENIIAQKAVFQFLYFKC